ncbi:MAG: TIGR03936 family radical SAM-associated protein [Acidimicrobiales bacterium]
MNMNLKVRLRFSKLGKIRFISHRDVARIWERALRRAELPVAYTEGFSPRPKLSFGLALSTGHESLGEYLDVDLRTDTGPPIEVDELAARLDPCLPVGLDARGAVAIEPGTTSLQQAVTSCTWRIEVIGVGADRLASLAGAALAAGELPITRSRKGREEQIDLRPAVLSAEVAGPTDWGAALVAELATQPRSVRPSDLLAGLGSGLEEGRVCRTHQWILVDGEREEPVPPTSEPAAAPSPHAEARAS